VSGPKVLLVARALQPLEEDVILNVILAALHSRQDLAAHQSTNSLLHEADARGGLAQAFGRMQLTSGTGLLVRTL
jgi:hypothetical protein